ncbi:helix-loop-helix protein delilah-like [Periplaneta americana]|uniref:helix-loop-helix protein delilah-like n=1 Tax=Periplaneta americana TaxID=6978 RepID=UPI0037E77DA7
MSSLVHSVVSDVISSHQRLQQQQQQLTPTPTSCAPPLLSNEHLDSNNNADAKQKTTSGDKGPIKAGSSGEKYSLRPRSLQRRSESEDSDSLGASSGRGTSRRGSSGGAGGRTKQKPPPLSKYRRKTANARERDRMREINAAFETLRRAVPHISASAHQNQPEGGEKLTKITTLRLAMKYIAALSQALQQPEQETPSCSASSLQLMSDGESLTLSEHCLTPPDLRQQSLTPPDFSRQSLTPVGLSRLSSPDPRVTPPLDKRHIQTTSDINRHCLSPGDLNRHCISSSDLNRHCISSSVFNRHCLSSSRTVASQKSVLPPVQNLLSPEMGISPHCLTTPPSSAPTVDLARHCLLTAGLEQPAAPEPSQLCLTSPVMTRTCLPPPDLSQHCLTPADFEEHAVEEHSSLLVFDDDSLDSPDLDHLLIS